MTIKRKQLIDTINNTDKEELIKQAKFFFSSRLELLAELMNDLDLFAYPKLEVLYNPYVVARKNDNTFWDDSNFGSCYEALLYIDYQHFNINDPYVVNNGGDIKSYKKLSDIYTKERLTTVITAMLDTLKDLINHDPEDLENYTWLVDKVFKPYKKA